MFISKLDIKDVFWKMVCEIGQEWNFAYVLPNLLGEPIKVVTWNHHAHDHHFQFWQGLVGLPPHKTDELPQMSSHR